MKVLFISNLFPPHFIGGYEIACKDTYELLLENNIESVVLTSDYFNNDSVSIELKESEKSVYRILKIHTDYKSFQNTMDYNFVDRYNQIQISDFVKSYNPDIIYCWNIYGLGTRFLTIINKNRIVFHIMDLSLFTYDYSFRKWLKSFLLPNRNRTTRLVKHLKNTIFVSNFVANKFSNYHIPNQTVIYPFLKNMPSDYLKINYNKKAFLNGVYLGQIESQKGILELCVILKEINLMFPNTKIFLDVYYGSSLFDLDNLIKTNFDFITIYKGVPREEIFSKLKDYDLGFFPSIWEEPFGIAQIELMAIGLPVFSSGRGGSKEVLNKYNSFEFRDFDHLKKLILEFFDDDSTLVQKIGQKAQRDILLNHNSDNYLRHLLTFFQKVIISG